MGRRARGVAPSLFTFLKVEKKAPGGAGARRYGTSKTKPRSFYSAWVLNTTHATSTAFRMPSIFAPRDSTGWLRSSRPSRGPRGGFRESVGECSSSRKLSRTDATAPGKSRRRRRRSSAPRRFSASAPLRTAVSSSAAANAWTASDSSVASLELLSKKRTLLSSAARGFEARTVFRPRRRR